MEEAPFNKEPYGRNPPNSGTRLRFGSISRGIGLISLGLCIASCVGALLPIVLLLHGGAYGTAILILVTILLCTLMGVVASFPMITESKTKEMVVAVVASSLLVAPVAWAYLSDFKVVMAWSWGLTLGCVGAATALWLRVLASSSNQTDSDGDEPVHVP